MKWWQYDGAPFRSGRRGDEANSEHKEIGGRKIGFRGWEGKDSRRARCSRKAGGDQS